MKFIRNRVDKWLQVATGGSGSISAKAAGAGGGSRKVEVFWLIALSVVVALSFGVTRIASSSVAEWILAVLWGFFLGSSLLVFLSQKLLITAMGSVLGIGSAEVIGASSVVEHVAKSISGTVKALNSALENQIVFHTGPAWLFLFILLLCWLPAYGEKS